MEIIKKKNGWKLDNVEKLLEFNVFSGPVPYSAKSCIVSSSRQISDSFFSVRCWVEGKKKERRIQVVMERLTLRLRGRDEMIFFFFPTRAQSNKWLACCHNLCGGSHVLPQFLSVWNHGILPLPPLAELDNKKKRLSVDWRNRRRIFQRLDRIYHMM